MAYTWKAQLKYKEAMEAFCHALKIRQEVLGSRHKEVAHTCYAMGCVLAQLNQRTNARVMFEQALEIYSEVHGESHRLVPGVRKKIATSRPALLVGC